MYQGRLVHVVPEGAELPPIGSTVLLNRQLLKKMGTPFMGRKNILVTASKNNVDDLEGIDLTETPIYVSPCIEAAICMDDREVFIIGSLKLVKAAAPFADTIPQS